ncbi:MAG: 4-hydroxy-tetrahydrodipicolinate synthase [Oscillospiraceae bacterium]|nr:4-hydroxy-tetrahydrodipicolinate synthase [Oscillospiraceae bacterium]
MKNTIFTGAGVAIITPMNEDGSVNYQVLAELIEFQLTNGTDAIIACGTTGESSTLSTEEHLEVIRFTIEKVNGRVPVIAGTGSNDTSYAIELSQEAEKLGASALLLVTPYYNKCSQSGLIAHFTAIAESVNIPIIIYSVASRTGVNIAPETCAVLAKHRNIAAVKEASGNLSQVAKIAALCGDEIDIYSGNDDQIVPILSLGGVGVISVLSNVAPQIAHDIVAKYLAGDVKGSAKLQLEWLDLCNDLFIDVNPIPVKTAVNLMGYKAGRCRMPLSPMDAKAEAVLAATLQRHGLIQ